MVLLIKILSLLGLKNLNPYMSLGKNNLNSMILSLDPKDPIIKILKQKLIEIPFENTSKFGSYLITHDQSLISSSPLSKLKSEGEEVE